MRLYRPVGLKELRLIADSGFRAFPPRLPSQPIFYPVMNIECAREIASAWNANDEAAEFVGFVTQFDVDDQFASRACAAQTTRTAQQTRASEATAVLQH